VATRSEAGRGRLVDGVYAIADIPERRQFFYVTPPIIESAYAVFAHGSSTLT
jgi:hypothetical protein